MEKMGGTLLSGTETCNPAYEIFQKNIPYLLMTIQDPEILAQELFAKNIVSRAVVESVSSRMQERGVMVSKLLMAVESQIEVNPGVFNMFLSVLAKQHSMSDLYWRMKDAYSKLLEQFELVCSGVGSHFVSCTLTDDTLSHVVDRRHN